MNFCSHCGQPVTLQTPENDDRPRHVCTHCDTIHYQNPLIVTGCLPIFHDSGEDRVLLCKRSIEPRYGKWTLPAGFMENDETAEQGAARECREEACAEVEIGELYTMTSIPRVNQVHLFFHAILPEPKFSSGPESLEVALFRESEIPWDNLSFTAVRITLQSYFSDRANGNFPCRSGWAGPNERGQWQWHEH